MWLFTQLVQLVLILAAIGLALWALVVVWAVLHVVLDGVARLLTRLFHVEPYSEKEIAEMEAARKAREGPKPPTP
jgi:fatty acid desaturase